MAMCTMIKEVKKATAKNFPQQNLVYSFAKGNLIPNTSKYISSEKWNARLK